MADHGKVEYAIAEGNDMPAHEATYNDFLRLAYVATFHVINIAVGLAIILTVFKNRSTLMIDEVNSMKY